MRRLKTNTNVVSTFSWKGFGNSYNGRITIFFIMNTGTVKFFNDSKGFGFIVDNSSKEEIFVHASGLVDNIREGDVVTYDTERGKKGMNAVDVKIA